MKNWKTTSAGIATILAGVAAALAQYSHGQPVDLTVLFSALVTGIGLIAAHDANPTEPPKNIVPLLFIFGVLASTLALQACDSFERQAFDSLSASHAVVEQARVDYVSGKIPRTEHARAVIEEASYVQNLAVDALLEYESAVKLKSHDVAARRQTLADLMTRLPLMLARIKALTAAVASRDSPLLAWQSTLAYS